MSFVCEKPSECPVCYEPLNEDKALFIFLANYEIMNDADNKWFMDMDGKHILNGKWWISSLYRNALK